MPHDVKIATCSYCGSRQALQLTARYGHELACGSCGAPLHEMKWLRTTETREAAKPSPRRPAPHGTGLPGRDWDDPRRAHKGKKKKKGKKKRKGLFRDVMEEAFDVLEDIFD